MQIMALVVQNRDQRAPSPEEQEDMPASKERCCQQSIDERRSWPLSGSKPTIFTKKERTVVKMACIFSSAILGTYGSGTRNPLCENVSTLCSLVVSIHLLFLELKDVQRWELLVRPVQSSSWKRSAAIVCYHYPFSIKLTVG